MKTSFVPFPVPLCPPNNADVSWMRTEPSPEGTNKWPVHVQNVIMCFVFVLIFSLQRVGLDGSGEKERRRAYARAHCYVSIYIFQLNDEGRREYGYTWTRGEIYKWYLTKPGWNIKLSDLLNRTVFEFGWVCVFVRESLATSWRACAMPIAQTVRYLE